MEGNNSIPILVGFWSKLHSPNTTGLQPPGGRRYKRGSRTSDLRQPVNLPSSHPRDLDPSTLADSSDEGAGAAIRSPSTRPRIARDVIRPGVDRRLPPPPTAPDDESRCA